MKHKFSTLAYVGGMVWVAALVACSSTEERVTDMAVPSSGSAAAPAPAENKARSGSRKTQEPSQESSGSGNSRPQGSSMYVGLNEAIRNQNDELILKESNQILLQHPNDLKSLNALAMSSYRKGRFSLAKYLLNKAKQAHPNSYEVYSNQGIVHLALDERRDAIQSFKKAIQLNSEDAVAAANIGSIYVLEKDYGKAKVALEIAYRKGFRDVKVLNNYAIALAANSKYDKALDLYDEILKQQPSNKEALFNSSVVLIDHLKKYNEGLDRLQKLKFIGGPADSKNKIMVLENKAKAGLK